MSSIQPPPGVQGPQGVAPGAHAAWGQVRWAVNRVAPASLRRSQRYRAQTMRLLRHRLRLR